MRSEPYNPLSPASEPLVVDVTVRRKPGPDRWARTLLKMDPSRTRVRSGECLRPPVQRTRTPRRATRASAVRVTAASPGEPRPRPELAGLAPAPRLGADHVGIGSHAASEPARLDHAPALHSAQTATPNMRTVGPEYHFAEVAA